MKEKNRLLTLMCIFTIICLGVVISVILIFYKASINGQKEQLGGAAQSLARLIESISRFDQNSNNTLFQIKEAYANYEGFGDTGEFTLAKHQGGNIIFLLNPRHVDLENLQPVPFDSKLAEPMRRALSGQSGVLIGDDYRGKNVLAAYEPISVLNWGLVLKMDMGEIQKTYLNVGIVAVFFIFLFILIFFFVLQKFINPLKQELQATKLKLEKNISLLTQSESQFNTLVEKNKDGLVVIDRNSIILFANAGAESIFNRPNSELIGMDIGFPVSLEDTDEIQIHQPSGNVVAVSIRVAQIVYEEVPCFLLSLRDITKQKETEELGQHLNTVLRSIRNVNQLIVHEKQMDRLIQKTCENLIVTRGFSGAWIVLTWSGLSEIVSAHAGFEKDSFNGFEDIFRSDNLPSCCQIDNSKENFHTVEKVLTDCKNCPLAQDYGENAGIRVKLIYKNKSYGWMGVSVPTRFMKDTEEISLLNEMAEDISYALHNIEVEKEREEKQRELLTLMNNLPGIAYRSLNTLGLPTKFLSQGCFKLTGYVPSDLIQGHKPQYRDLIHPDDRQKVWETIQESIKKERRFVIEYRIRDKNGQERWMKEYGQAVSVDNNGRTILEGLILDNTELKYVEEERKKYQKQLLHAQKLESIGNLAGGIAHDFNNILFPIVGMAEFLLEDLPIDSFGYENAKEILKAGQRGSDLVTQILTFSRQSEHKKLPTPVQSVLKEVLKLCRSTIPSDITIKQEIQYDCSLIMADPTQIHQIAMNIVTNAYHAVEDDGGEIYVSLKEAVLTASDLPDPKLKAGVYVVLSISDTGHGIPPELINNIFDPYFTTKEQGKGTGLGLAVVHGIMKEHKGAVKVSSEIGKGSTFDIYFPSMGKSDIDESYKLETMSPVGNERILLVDDEPSVAKLEKLMLERLGYMVTEKHNSTDALKTFKSEPNDFDLIITDMTMPNITGDKLAKKIIAIRPDIPIIICTGFSERMDKNKAESYGIRGFLMKPVVKSDLSQMVRNVLDESKSFD